MMTTCWILPPARPPIGPRPRGICVPPATGVPAGGWTPLSVAQAESANAASAATMVAAVKCLFIVGRPPIEWFAFEKGLIQLRRNRNERSRRLREVEAVAFGRVRSPVAGRKPRKPELILDEL